MCAGGTAGLRPIKALENPCLVAGGDSRARATLSLFSGQSRLASLVKGYCFACAFALSFGMNQKCWPQQFLLPLIQFLCVCVCMRVVGPLSQMIGALFANVTRARSVITGLKAKV